MRERISINEGWLFSCDGVAQTVDLPHTWNNLDGQDGADGYMRACCSYRKQLDPMDGCVFLDVEGANSCAEVYVDGVEICTHKGGYSAFRADLTPYIKNGCTLDIRVDNSDKSDVYPSVADFTFYGGLYRDVSLVRTGSCRFSFMESSSDGVYVTPVRRDGFWEVMVRALVDCPDDRFDITYTLLDAEGNTVVAASAKPTDPDVRFKIIEPHLWQGTEDPYLYTLECRITADGECSDSLDIPVGFREIHVDSEKGFFLNGKPVKLKGVARHQDRENMGNAITRQEHKQDVELICELGANSIRLAHYQHNRYFYDLCDRAGLLVWAEVPVISHFSAKKQRNARQQLCELIRQNYNHPCIYCWGIQNEITITGGPRRKKLIDALLELNEIVHRLDSTRYSTSAQVAVCGMNETINRITDLQGYNNYYGWYVGDFNEIDKWLDEFHRELPDVRLCLSEYGAEGITRYHTDKPAQGDYSEEYQALFHEHYAKTINDREWLFGSYVWNMFDFGSASRNEGGVRGRNNKGLVTFDRKIKKDSFYLYKAWWSDDSFVHITGERYVNRPVGTASIRVYSNCGSVTLTVNGESRTLSADKVFVFDGIEIKPGENTLTAESGECVHTLTVNGVAQPDASYSMPEDARTFVRNWFEPDDGSDRLSLDDTVGDLLNSSEAVELLSTYVGSIAKSPVLKVASPIKLRTLLKVAKPFGLGDNIEKLADGYLRSIKK